MDVANSGFQGPWGSGGLNKVSNSFFINLLGVGFQKAMLTQVTTTSATFGTKVQWNSTGGMTRARVMLHADMGIYYDYTPDAVTKTTSYVYYPQGNNATLTQGNLPNSAPLAPNRAQQAFNYAKNNTLFLNDLIEAMKKMLSVPNTATELPLSNYYPQIICINNVKKCHGDIYLTNCGLPSFNETCG